MNFKNLLICILLVNSIYIKAQSKKDILFTVADTPVYTDEFVRVFNKNRDIVAEENKKSVEEYLELYINYKLKLKQAYALKYDTVSSFKNELNSYREQLIVPYLKDSKITESLIQEAYDRLKLEVNASHILVRVSKEAMPADTLKAYNKILEARMKVVNGQPFEEVAKEYSEDPSVKSNGGNLGYFTVFDMVYDFENAAYNTEIGKVSMPFKTQFGYHIVKVNDKRPSSGEVEVAHIVIKHNPQDSLYAKTKINEVYAKVKQGDPFNVLANKHSDDKVSAIKGGALPKFNANRMIKPFSDVAFSLKEVNDVSEPFKTNYGWHIVKLLKKHPIGDIETRRGELVQKTERNERSKKAGKSVVKKLMNSYNISVDTNLKEAFIANNKSKLDTNLDNAIFTINGEKTLLSDLVEYSKGRIKNIDTFTNFLELKVLDYYKANLEKTDADFAFTMQEYKDGLLLFELLQNKVWKKAEMDTIGLKAFYRDNADKYMQNKRGDVIIASCTEEEKALLVKNLLEAGKSIKEIKSAVNEGPTIHVLFTNGILEENHRKYPKGFVLEDVGVSKVFKENTNNFVVVKTNKILPPEPMKFEKARGKVINDYQQQLENDWIAELKNRYPVKINKRVLKKVIKQNQN
ncbi:peptidylprolyl isomerase [Aureibaculum marinum]|uniref:Peptidylprolyl isomerase n=1 Tax=Aureibaculum marinum TaxID=2487930 RepID=A0A3N4PAT0_9FLAO|nr:peptidylprolyl isomerase [Aureibaculum marinum]RPE00830.1 peptidylprolyl isomerase [Aureibaculum marinum]